MDIQYGNLNQLHWLWLVAACGIVVVVASVLRRRAARRFATANLLPRFLPASGRAGALARGLLVTAAMAMLVVALIDLRWGKVRREVPQRGIEVMFVLDVSRSMLAEDATPNRLQRAKQQIVDMVDEMAGDRIGLVVFAGDAHQQVPLTSHYADFKQSLADVGPYDTYRGGSKLGDAIEAAAEGFLDKTAGHKAIVLLTDGEDQGSEPAEAARRVHQQQGIHVFTVGLGDRDQGARIPARSGNRNDFVRHEGRVVWSKLEEEVLRQMASEAEGAYIPAGTKRVDMAGVYQRYISPIQAREFAMAQIDAYRARFQWLLVPAVMLLLVEMVLSSWPKKTGAVKRMGRSVMTAGLFCLLGSSAAAQPLGPEDAERVRQANRWLQDGQLEQAVAVYEELAASHPRHPQLLYNQAVARYRLGQIDEAARLFQQVAAASDPALAAKAHYNLGNTDYRAALNTARRDPAAAIERLESAIRRYRRALSLDGGDDEARANIELAGRLIDRWQQQLEEQREAKREPSGQQEHDRPDQQDRSGEQRDQAQQPQGDEQQGHEQQGDEQQGDRQQQEQANQQNQAGEGEQQEQPPQQSQQDGSQQQSAPGQQQDDPGQGSGQEPRGEQQERDAQQSGGEPSQRSEPRDGNSSPQPSEPRQSSAGGSSADAPSDDRTAGPPDRFDGPPEVDAGASQDEGSESPPPDGQLSAAGDGQTPAGEAAAGSAAQLDPDQLAPMTQQEAQKMLQAIRDRDMLRRLREQQQRRARRVPVEKDW